MSAPHDIGCPLCKSRETLACVHRESVPVQQNQLLTSANAARALARGSLRLQWCPQCGFGFNADFNPELCQYGSNYDNSQAHSPRFAAHVERLVQQLVHEAGVRNCRIVEVGCGQGDFLRRLVFDRTLGNTGVGFDPAYTGPDEQLVGRMTFQRRYFDADAAVEADVVVCRHVIEHVPRPVEFLQSIAAAMMQGRGRRLFLETPALEWILEHRVVWDLFYEHCSLFTANSLTAALRTAGFGGIHVRRVFGEQYLWAEAELGAPQATLAPDCDRLTTLAVEFSQHAACRTSEWVDMLTRLRGDGDIAVWGAGAKGVTFCHLVDPHYTRIDAVIDINPAKQGKFVPGTGHPIVSPADWARRSSGNVLVLNPNYHSEVAATLRRLQSPILPVDLMAVEAAA